MPAIPITLASRDSLLALTQTVEAAMRLEKAGFAPRIATMKTAGDIKLNAPLYDVAKTAAPKEGRAFFTRELDDALLGNRADAAVHSFKDLPAEPVPGITAPVFFSEQNGADALLLGNGAELSADGAGLVIGTSSLRRIHQLQCLLPAAKTMTLRGNVITRLAKLDTAAGGINSILIAAAGLRRIDAFAQIDTAEYAHFLSPEIVTHIQNELARYRVYAARNFRQHEIPESVFPTAPGQGVLALQLTEQYEREHGSAVRQVFAEHSHISDRVMHERRVMTELNTGCHAPLGVSALNTTDDLGRKIVACFSRVSATDPVSFSESVFLERNVTPMGVRLSDELRAAPAQIFWWGFKKPALTGRMPKMVFIQAVAQTVFAGAAPPGQYDALFAASPAVAAWLQQHEREATLPVWTPGAETAAALSAQVPGLKVHSAGEKSFATALAVIEKSPRLLWLGSANGEARARKAAAGRANTDFLAVYENTPTAAAAIEPILRGHPAAAAPQAIHVLTSAASAQAFTGWAKAAGAPAFRIFCFGASAAEVVHAAGLTPYLVSDAADFTDFMREISGDISLMRQRWNLRA